MSANPKSSFPPLFPPGLQEIPLAAIGQVFVGPALDTPLRRRLTNQLHLFIGELKRLDAHGDLWIDGSYATKKPEPGDVDLALSLPLVIAKAMSDDHLDRLKFLSDPSNRAYVRAKWQVDFYVFEASNIASRSSFLDLFSRSPDGSNRKGIPFVRL